MIAIYGEDADALMLWARNRPLEWTISETIAAGITVERAPADGQARGALIRGLAWSGWSDHVAELSDLLGPHLNRDAAVLRLTIECALAQGAVN